MLYLDGATLANFSQRPHFLFLVNYRLSEQLSQVSFGETVNPGFVSWVIRFWGGGNSRRTGNDIFLWIVDKFSIGQVFGNGFRMGRGATFWGVMHLPLGLDIIGSGGKRVMSDEAEIERGLDNVHAWINYAIASGVPETIMWEWLFHTKPEGPVIVTDILSKVDDLVKSGQLTVQQIFDIATESVSQDSAYEAGDPTMVYHVREYLENTIRLWKNGY
ncbi:hypothetical protein [Desulfofundulus kuznetsovii]